MAIEIEHKFLIKNSSWRQHINSSVGYRQGYMTTESNVSVRVRISDDKAWLNIKSAVKGSQRDEYEYQIPLPDGHEMINNLCRKPLIEKTRHFIKIDQHTWEIDEFEGDNAGLIVAEIELSRADETFSQPQWLGDEVTDDIRYYNNSLSLKPYKNWEHK
jgi:adenylate cyclase